MRCSGLNEPRIRTRFILDGATLRRSSRAVSWHCRVASRAIWPQRWPIRHPPSESACVAPKPRSDGLKPAMRLQAGSTRFPDPGIKGRNCASSCPWMGSLPESDLSLALEADTFGEAAIAAHMARTACNLRGNTSPLGLGILVYDASPPSRFFHG